MKLHKWKTVKEDKKRRNDLEFLESLKFTKLLDLYHIQKLYDNKSAPKWKQIAIERAIHKRRNAMPNSRGIECEFEVDRDGESVTVYVKANVSFGMPAKTYGPPENCYPAEPDEVDYELFTDYHMTKAWSGVLTGAEEDRLTQHLIDLAYDMEDNDADYDDYDDDVDQDYWEENP